MLGIGPHGETTPAEGHFANLVVSSPDLTVAWIVHAAHDGPRQAASVWINARACCSAMRLQAGAVP